MTRKSPLRIIPWDEAVSLLSSSTIEVNQDKLTIVEMSHKSLPELPCFKLSPIQSQYIASLLISLVGVPNYTPTVTDHPVPLRLDLMIERLLGQPPAFLPILLRKWCEWFSLQPSQIISKSWEDFIKGHSNRVNGLSNQLASLTEYHLLCSSKEFSYLPLPVLIATVHKTQQPNWEVLPRLLQKIRHSLLKSRQVNSTIQSYNQITAFLRSPHPRLDSQSERMIKGRGELVDITNHDWLTVSQPVIEAVLASLSALYEADPDYYQEVFNRVHGPIWDTVGQVWTKLIEIERNIPNDSIFIDATDYAKSCRVISDELRRISKAYTVLTELETILCSTTIIRLCWALLCKM